MNARLPTAAIALVTALLAPPAHADMVGKARIIDGNTLEIAGQRIRLHGIDAPEPEQTCTAHGEAWPCGQDATFALANIVANHWVTCLERGRDKSGDIAATCTVGDKDVAALMVGQGLALAYRPDSEDYVGAEVRAMDDHRGLWRGEFIPPWDWRAARR